MVGVSQVTIVMVVLDMTEIHTAMKGVMVVAGVMVEGKGEVIVAAPMMGNVAMIILLVRGIVAMIIVMVRGIVEEVEGRVKI